QSEDAESNDDDPGCFKEERSVLRMSKLEGAEGEQGEHGEGAQGEEAHDFHPFPKGPTGEGLDLHGLSEAAGQEEGQSADQERGPKTLFDVDDFFMKGRWESDVDFFAEVKDVEQLDSQEDHHGGCEESEYSHDGRVQSDDTAEDAEESS